MRIWQLLYWLIAGAAVGFGIIGILSIGFPFLVLGVGMIAFGVARFRIRDAWAALVGFGMLPALVFWYDIATAPPPCQSSIVLSIHGGTASCGDIPPSYTVMAIFFGAVALVGLILPLAIWMLRRRRA